MRIVSVTSVRDEGPFLLEWIAWHRLIGVTDFLIFSNDCRDGTGALLDALAAAGVVQHRPHQPAGGKSIQWQALKSAWADPLRKAADWMLISDVDEFPVVHCGAGRLADLFAALPEGVDAVALAWRLFGAGGAVEFTSQPVTQSFTRSAPGDMLHPVSATMFKSLFRPGAFQRPGVHRPERRPGSPTARWVDGSGRALPGHIAEDDKRLSLIPLRDHRRLAEMHHYSLRTVESFIVKAERGLPNRTTKRIDLHYWVERNFNNQPNEAALRHAAALAQGMAELMDLPGVAALHDAACVWHRDAFARLIRQPDYYRLWTGCLHAGGSAVLSDPLALKVLRGFQALQNPG